MDREGFPRPVLAFLLEEAVSAGIEKVGVVVCPGDAVHYERAAADARAQLTLIELAAYQSCSGKILELAKSPGGKFIGWKHRACYKPGPPDKALLAEGLEKLRCEVTALPDVECAFLRVPRSRGRQLKSQDQLDCWLRDGSAAVVEALGDRD